MPKRQSKAKTVYTQEKTMVDEHGEVKSQETTKIIKHGDEPHYIKLYLNTLLTFKDLPKQMSAVLFELLKLMTFADPEADHGGQLILLNAFIKKQIIKTLKIKMNTLDQYIMKLTKSGIIKRVGLGTYQANPSMFGRGEWLDIKRIRATFDFNAGTVDANIETEEK